ncbi:receptor-like protein 33 [Cryptomeria japonica]|uniref:receptor-like protein 33 n=1 Tax=Cryptomeria japonica TaxID=3369 RepID=UPI0025AC8482|nr:receptor-like protein 33 [Cryptomeria japonica]
MRVLEELLLDGVNMLQVTSNEWGKAISAMYSLRRLQMSNCMLSGPIPLSLANLSSLTHLQLGGNSSFSSIPARFHNLSKLVSLKLSSCELNGSIPSDLLSLPNLQEVDFSANLDLGGNPSTILPRHSSRLKRLVLTATNVGGAIPDSIANISSLTFLDLSDCSVQGNLPPTIANLTALVMLDISNNKLKGSIPSFGAKRPLETPFPLAYIDLSTISCRATYPLCCSVHLGSSGALPSKLTGTKKLKVLDLHSNYLQHQLPLPPPSVLVLDLSENQFSASIPVEIGESNLWYLSLSHNNLSGRIPPTLCNIPSPNMKILDFSYNSLTGKIPASLANCSSLVVLNLEKNCLVGELPAELGSLISLQTLKISGNNLNGTLPTLANCKQLQILDVGDNRLTGNISSNGIQELSNLKILILRSNKFEGTVPADVSKIPSLQILDLSMNRLTGVIPVSISEMRGMANWSENTKVFEFEWLKDKIYVEKIIIRNKGLELEYVRFLSLVKCLDLSGNRISGHVPQGMGSLAGLIILNISRNNISGTIPESLGNMAQLESLDLSKNQLSGIIPAALVNLTFLSYLNLSYNNLTGMIPQGAQFATFEASSFSHNPGLHGLQLNESWSPSPKDESKPKKKEGVNKNRARERNDSFIVLMGMSFGVGAGTIVAPLLFLKKRREKFFDLLASILIWIVDLIPCEKCISCDKLQIVKISDGEDQEHSKESKKKLIRFCDPELLYASNL